MLLANLIDKFQNQYADIQAQIEDLQEQQRKIQAHLQQLGSVESQMVSAVQMLQESIKSINDTCPEQLPQYQEIVTNLFSTPVAALNPSQPESDTIIVSEEPQPDPSPTSSQTLTEAEADSSNVVTFARPQKSAEIKSTPKQEPLFKFSISHSGDYITYWKEDEDGNVTILFKNLKIRPRDKKKTDGYNPFSQDKKGICFVAYLTNKAFSKIEDQSEYIDFDKLD